MRGVAIVGVISFGLGVAVALLVGGRDRGRSERAPAPPAGTVPEVAILEARLRESEAANAALRSRLEAHAPAEVGEAPEGAGAPGTRDRGPRFVDAAGEAALRAVDWQQAGEAVARILPLLSEASEVAHGKRELRAALFGDITRWFGPIITEAIKLEQAGVPWSSPSVLANLVHATLVEAGEPLDAAQQEALGAIGSRHWEEDARRRASYGETTPRMRRMVEEARMIDRFFAEVDPIFDHAQRAALYPPGVRGIVGLDVFGSSSVWDEKLGRIRYADRAGLRAAAMEAHARDLGLRAEILPHLESAVGEWERALPDAFVAHEADAAAKGDVKMERSDRVLLAAERQWALYESLLARAPLLDEERARIVAQDTVLVPLLVR
jgi:hypothetical protein